VEHTKIANPINEQVEELHSKFVQSLITLFEEYKYKYLENPEDKYLEQQRNERMFLPVPAKICFLKDTVFCNRKIFKFDERKPA
jgi:hypothetical protein